MTFLPRGLDRGADRRDRLCLYFMISLPSGTLVRFAICNLIGVGVYLAYGRRRSLLAQTGS